MDDQEFLRDWLRDVTRERGSKIKAAAAVGGDPATITKIIKGGRRFQVGEPRKIAEALGVPAPRPETQGHIDSADILRDHDLNDQIPEDRMISTVNPYEPKLPNASPVWAAHGGMGGGGIAQTGVTTRNGITYSADALIGEVVLPPPVSASLSPAPTNRIHWLEVRGDSMVPTLNGGDWVGANTTDVSIGQGGVFALRDSNGEILVKRLRRLRGDKADMVEIISDNAQQGVDREAIENITVFGRIVARISRVG